jgi:hypothetical protein
MAGFGQDLVSAVLSSDVTDPAGGAVVAAEVTATSTTAAVVPTATTNGTLPFRREQYAGSEGGSGIKNKAWFCTAFGHLDQMGGVLVGTPDLNTDTIINSFMSALAIDAMGTVRDDWQIINQEALTMRYSIGQLGATGGSSPDHRRSNLH